jgi:DNA polymerase sigma
LGHPASIRDHHEMAFHKTLGDQLLQLTKTIDDALDEAAQARQHCFDLIRNLATNTFPELALSFDVYGSMTTKLAIDSSDMDIAIYGIQQEARTAALQELSDKLKQYKCVRHNQPILTASVPVVKLELSFAELAEDLKIPEVRFGKIKSIKIDLVIHDQNGQ